MSRPSLPSPDAPLEGGDAGASAWLRRSLASRSTSSGSGCAAVRVALTPEHHLADEAGAGLELGSQSRDDVGGLAGIQPGHGASALDWRGQAERLDLPDATGDSRMTARSAGWRAGSADVGPEATSTTPAASAVLASRMRRSEPLVALRHQAW